MLIKDQLGRSAKCRVRSKQPFRMYTTAVMESGDSALHGSRALALPHIIEHESR
jgi:hypothetical protein